MQHTALRPPLAGFVAALVLSSMSPALSDAQVGANPSPELLSLVQTARRDIDGYWSRTIKGYTSPADVVMIRVPTITDCGQVNRPTAMYCMSSNKIYWDVGMFTNQYQIGDFAPVFVLAHEWGHMVQRMLGFMRTDRGLLGVQLELQADCFAGEYAADARKRKMLDPGDDDEAAVSLRRAGDRLDHSWFDASAHGTAGQRIDAFTYGFEGKDCAAPAFFEFLKTRGIDPSKAQQQPAPNTGRLEAMLPRSVGRFTLVSVKREQLANATDALSAQYRTIDGIVVGLGLSSHRNSQDSRARLDAYVNSLVTQKGYKEIKRVDLVNKVSKEPVGVVITLHGANEVVIWANKQTLVSVVGPRDITHELYRVFPF